MCLGKISCRTAGVFSLLAFNRSSPSATPAGGKFLRRPCAAQRNFSGTLAKRPCARCSIEGRTGFDGPSTFERSSLVVPCGPGRTRDGLFFKCFLYFFGYNNVRRADPTG